MLYNDSLSVEANRAAIKAGYIGADCLGALFSTVARHVVSCWAVVIITYFVFTIDEEGAETPLDQVKDFTALIIIVDIDTILLNDFVHISFEAIKLAEHFENETATKVLDRYLKYQEAMSTPFRKIVSIFLDIIFAVVQKLTYCALFIMYLFVFL